MFQRHFLLLSLIWITIITLFWYQARAEEALPLTSGNIAFVDIENVVNRSQVAKSAGEIIEKKRSESQKEIDQEEEKLRKEEAEIAKEKDKLSVEAFEKKHQLFRNKVMEFQRKVQTKRVDLGGISDKINQKINQTCLEIIASLGKKRDYIMVLPTSQTLYVNTKQDISEEVLKELNKKLPKIDAKDLK